MKTRTDSWAAALPEEAEWSLFYKARRCQWQEAVVWAAQEFSLERKPSRSGFYAWLKTMGEKEHEHNMSQALIAQANARDLAKDFKISDETSIKSLMATATEAALVTHDAKLAKSLVETALAIRDRAQKAKELSLKERAQQTKESELVLAREKFEFDAAKAAMAKVAEIKTISADASLAADEKIAKVRSALFGEAAK